MKSSVQWSTIQAKFHLHQDLNPEVWSANLSASQMLWEMKNSSGYPSNQMMCNAQKGPLCNLRTMHALISLHISAGWSRPSLSIYGINGYCNICWWTKNAQIRLHGCGYSSGPLLFTFGIRALFQCCTSNFKDYLHIQNSFLLAYVWFNSVNTRITWHSLYFQNCLSFHFLVVFRIWCWWLKVVN